MLRYAFAVLSGCLLPCVALGDQIALEGVWKSEQVKSDWFELRDDDTVELRVTKLSDDESRIYREKYGFIEGVQRVEFFVHPKSGKKRRLGDSEPGWIDKKGRICLGPVGSAVILETELRRDKKSGKNELRLSMKGVLIVLVPKESK